MTFLPDSFRDMQYSDAVKRYISSSWY